MISLNGLFQSSKLFKNLYILQSTWPAPGHLRPVTLFFLPFLNAKPKHVEKYIQLYAGRSLPNNHRLYWRVTTKRKSVVGTKRRFIFCNHMFHCLVKQDNCMVIRLFSGITLIIREQSPTYGPVPYLLLVHVRLCHHSTSQMGHHDCLVARSSNAALTSTW